MQALLAFLRCAPLSDAGVWRAVMGAEDKRDGAPDLPGLVRVRLCVRAVCLRRSKAVLGDRLPPKTVEVRRVDMTAAAREVYDVLFRRAGFVS